MFLAATVLTGMRLRSYILTAAVSAALRIAFTGVPILCLVSPIAAQTARPDSAGVERVSYETSDGFSVLADLYRPARSGPVGAVFFHERSGSAAGWRLLARELSGRGWTVLVPELTSLGERARTGYRWGAGETAGGPEAQLWQDVLAAEAYLRRVTLDSVRIVVPGGIGLGAAAVAISASRMLAAPPALLLLAPEPELGGIPITPLLVGLESPVLAVMVRGDSPSSQVCRDLYLQAGERCRLWELEAETSGPRLLLERPLLSIDLADWLDGVSGRSRSGSSTGDSGNTAKRALGGR